jgi:hypothetical protein
MFAAHVLRVIQADRVVVSLDDSHSVVELQLSEPLSPGTVAKARSLVDPCRPVAVRVSPGEYRGGVFYGSGMGPLAIPSADRPRADYRSMRAPP